MSPASKNSFGTRETLQVDGKGYEIFRLSALEKKGVGHAGKLPFSLRVLLENLLRQEDGRFVHAKDIEALAGWDPNAATQKEISFMPARVLLQDFTGVPCVVDLAAMREAVRNLGGDPKKIISFKNKSSKAISETCLACHAGREEHNNFRRGEHWRNDIGCTECHAPHANATGRNLPGSNVFVAKANAQKPGISTISILKVGEPQLCMSCHSEVKPDFAKAFHHKVLEGAMKCSDCHNPHGGFELKQTRLATGADAACIKCHADKQGPFTYEHAPLKTEGCSVCHTPHGSSNPRLLRFSAVSQLCLTCHSVDHGL